MNKNPIFARSVPVQEREKGVRQSRLLRFFLQKAGKYAILCAIQISTNEEVLMNNPSYIERTYEKFESVLDLYAAKIMKTVGHAGPVFAFEGFCLYCAGSRLVCMAWSSFRFTAP